MTREEKNNIVTKLSKKFENSNAIVVADYKGTTHRQLEELRNMASESGVIVQVAKNSLVNLGLQKAKLEKLELTQPNIFLTSEDQISACKVADKFANIYKDSFTIKTGVVEKKTASIETIAAFAKLPSRDELLGMLAATWMAPVANFTIGLEALRKSKEESA
jgi:large subunit ribosomal protein L10